MCASSTMRVFSNAELASGLPWLQAGLLPVPVPCPGERDTPQHPPLPLPGFSQTQCWHPDKTHLIKTTLSLNDYHTRNEWQYVLILYTFVTVYLLFCFLATRQKNKTKTGTKHSNNFHNCITRHRYSVQNTIPWPHSHLSSVSLLCLVNKKTLNVIFKPFAYWK